MQLASQKASRGGYRLRKSVAKTYLSCKNGDNRRLFYNNRCSRPVSTISCSFCEIPLNCKTFTSSKRYALERLKTHGQDMKRSTLIVLNSLMHASVCSRQILNSSITLINFSILSTIVARLLIASLISNLITIYN